MASTPIHKISFNEADGGYTCSEQEVLKKELSKLNLYSSEFAYSAFKPALSNLVLKTGTFHRQNHPRKNEIDCCILNSSKSEIRDDHEYDLVHYLDLTAEKNKVTFAVYDKSKLKEMCHPYYKFKEPNKKLKALLAIIKANW